MARLRLDGIIVVYYTGGTPQADIDRDVQAARQKLSQAFTGTVTVRTLDEFPQQGTGEIVKALVVEVKNAQLR
ncbi:MAG TPA: hypothetical protein VJL31_10200 [Gemmatimonadales bacterium]|nr:hypothetical protein [Gemmatimonadales bacterium]